MVASNERSVDPARRTVFRTHEVVPVRLILAQQFQLRADFGFSDRLALLLCRFGVQLFENLELIRQNPALCTRQPHPSPPHRGILQLGMRTRSPSPSYTSQPNAGICDAVRAIKHPIPES